MRGDLCLPKLEASMLPPMEPLKYESPFWSAPLTLLIHLIRQMLFHWVQSANFLRTLCLLNLHQVLALLAKVRFWITPNCGLFACKSWNSNWFSRGFHWAAFLLKSGWYSTKNKCSLTIISLPFRKEEGGGGLFLYVKMPFVQNQTIRIAYCSFELYALRDIIE